MSLILASQSPRRKELMELFHLPFAVQAVHIDETMNPDSPADWEVARVSALKAHGAERKPGDVVIGADTIVVCGGTVLGKPKDQEDAFRMLSMLSGRDNQVMTGLTVLRDEQVTTCVQVTDLHFRSLGDEEIWAYIRTGEPMDKAGAYGIQGGGALFAERISGDYFNVVGLPVCRLGEILRKMAPDLMEERA